jgi:DNA-binding transcriptional LysR family regulator
MELRHLRYFAAVARELHFGRAAEKLHIAQPALSQQIKALEQELGAQLLSRGSRRVELTDAGRLLLDEGEAILARADRARHLVRLLGAGKSGQLRLSYTRSAPGGLAARIVDEFRRAHPTIAVETTTAFTARNLEDLKDGRTDVAFVRPPLAPAEGIASLTLGQEALVAVLPRGHRLTAKRRIAREALRDEPLVTGSRARGPGFFDSMFRQIWGGRPPCIVREEADEEHILRAVAAGIGVSVITESRAATLKFRGVVIRRFAEPQPQAELGLAWREGFSSPALERFLEVARAVARGGTGRT